MFILKSIPMGEPTILPTHFEEKNVKHQVKRVTEYKEVIDIREPELAKFLQTAIETGDFGVTSAGDYEAGEIGRRATVKLFNFIKRKQKILLLIEIF
jgi:hypothetical protein